MVVILPRLVLLCVGTGFAVWCLAMHYDPSKPHGRLLRCGVLGLSVLLLWNLLPLPKASITPLSVWITGVLGLPGAGLIAVLSQLP